MTDRVAGYTTHTSRHPASSQVKTLLCSSDAESEGETTSTTRSGASPQITGRKIASGQPLGGNEGSIGGANRIGVQRQNEPRSRSENRPQFPRMHELGYESAYRHCGEAVFGPCQCRLVQDSFDQFVTLAVVGQHEEFVGGHQLR